MIEAIIFDLDGTLIQSELLKAKSYARAAANLGQREIEENDVIEDFDSIATRDDVENGKFKTFFH